MQYYNNIYESRFFPGITVVVGNDSECKEVTKYLASFNKKVDSYYNYEKSSGSSLNYMTLNELRSISKNSYIILASEIQESVVFEQLGLKNIYVFREGRIECKDKVDINIQSNIFKYTNRVTFELSNLCGYAMIHKKCPLSLEKDHKTLSSKIVYDVLDCLHNYDYGGVISFHRYNEPLMDPRLLDFVRYARKKCPQSDIFLLTNGYYLTQDIMDSLVDAGVTIIDVTGYSVEEFERLSKINSSIAYRIFSSKFDDRLTLYDYDNTNSDLVPCFWPLTDLIITKDGKVGLCHFDWKSLYEFGDLHSSNIRDIILKSDILEVYNNNTKGIRKYKICQNCKNATRTPELSFFYSNIYFSPSCLK